MPIDPAGRSRRVTRTGPADFVFACPASQHVQWMKEHHAALFARIRDATLGGDGAPVHRGQALLPPRPTIVNKRRDLGRVVERQEEDPIAVADHADETRSAPEMT